LLRRRWLPVAAVALLAAAAAAGCSTVGYYAQAVHGHLALLAAARPIPQWLEDPAADEALKQRLARAQEIRAFASRELGLPDNGSYTAYADLKRPAAVWNVFAAPELSLQLKTWCYPVLGCAGYRGYFDRAAAEDYAQQLRAQGYDVNVAPVPAYSTLGWFDDPLLNTFVHAGEGELARLIFHELAHQVAYAKGDTVFNESFATLVERVGVRRWLAAAADEATRAAYAQQQARREDFLRLLLEHKRQLAAVYDSAASDDDKRGRKREIFAALRAEYARIKAERWGGFAGYDRYFAQELGNAHLAAVGAYNDLVPAFAALLRAHGDDLPRFYARVRELARAAPAARMAALQAALARN
jgi:predicted aminopeptidase